MLREAAPFRRVISCRMFAVGRVSRGRPGRLMVDVRAQRGAAEQELSMISRAEQLDTEAQAREAGGDVADERPEGAEETRNRLLDRAADSAPDLAELLGTYYRHVPGEEFAQDEPADLVAAVRAHRGLAAERVAGRAVVRVFNPDPET